MLANILLPKNAAPPYQAVIWFPGSYASTSSPAIETWYSPLLRFLAAHGRALVYPVYKGTYERQTPLVTRSQNRDLVIQWSKDLGRTIDYLESRVISTATSSRTTIWLACGSRPPDSRSRAASQSSDSPCRRSGRGGSTPRLTRSISCRLVPSSAPRRTKRFLLPSRDVAGATCLSCSERGSKEGTWSSRRGRATFDRCDPGSPSLDRHPGRLGDSLRARPLARIAQNGNRQPLMLWGFPLKIR